MKHLTPLGGLLLSACATIPVHQPGSTAPTFQLNSFFAGSTEGRGVLKVIFSAPKPVVVHGTGRIDPDGTLVLSQRVQEEGKPARQREWRIRENLGNRYAGTLSDASGPVDGAVTGNRLHLAFNMKGGLHAEQWLDLAPDGRSAQNYMLVRKFGVVVASLHERIRKVDRDERTSAFGGALRPQSEAGFGPSRTAKLSDAFRPPPGTSVVTFSAADRSLNLAGNKR
jgi:hypothetical protein